MNTENNKNLIVKFKQSEKQYIIPIDKLNKFPDCYFLRNVHFTNKFDCELDICSYEDFHIIFQYIMTDSMNIFDYTLNQQLLDYFGITITNKYIEIKKLFDLKYKTINDFINNKSKFLIMDSVDDYFIYKDIFKEHKHIIPFQYMIQKTIDNIKFKRDILFCGNGQLCDFSNIEKLFKNNVQKKQNIVIQKNFQYNLPFVWLFNFNKQFEDKDLIFECEKLNSTLNPNEQIANEQFPNEIMYIINCIILIFTRLFQKYQNFFGYQSMHYNNKTGIDHKLYLKYNKKNMYEYDLSNIQISFNDFYIRHDLHSLYKPLIKEKITFTFGSLSIKINIRVYLGFINTNFS